MNLLVFHLNVVIIDIVDGTGEEAGLAGRHVDIGQLQSIHKRARANEVASRVNRVVRSWSKATTQFTPGVLDGLIVSAQIEKRLLLFSRRCTKQLREL